MKNRTNPQAGPRILLGVCGAAAALTLPSYVAIVKSQLGAYVTVVLTTSATHFVTPAAIRLLADDVVLPNGDGMVLANHVRLATEHDVIVVLPATANMLGDVAHGLAPSLLTSILLATEAPVLFYPTMNRRMWWRAAVQRNIMQLRQDGFEVVEPLWRPGLELATGQETVNPVLPSPSEVADLLLARLTGASAGEPSPQPDPHLSRTG